MMESNVQGPNNDKKLDLNKPCRITNINFEGVYRTRPTLLARIVADIFQSNSLLDFLQKSTQVRENLANLNAFSDVDLQATRANDSEEDSYEVTFVVKERNWVNGGLQTTVDNRSAHMNFKLAFPNRSGLGDSIEFRLNERVASMECRYSIPLMPWRNLWNPTYSLAYNQYQWDPQPSGYDQDDKSLINQIDFVSLPSLQHTISFENIWRNIKGGSQTIPIEIREQFGHSLKSSLKHVMTWDNRIGGNFPYEGMMAKFSNETTTNLVKGGARFTRHEANLQLNALLLPKYDVICQANLLSGTLLRARKLNICDKFFAGGPLTLRGFKYQGLEPNVNGHPLGDASYLSAGLHIYSILPYTSLDSPINEYVRPHIFFNTGTIGDISELWRIRSREDVRREALRFRDSLRYSCGFGLVMYFMRLRLEINYSFPLIFKKNDLKERGLEWGLGMTYT